MTAEHGVARVGHDLETKPPLMLSELASWNLSLCVRYCVKHITNVNSLSLTANYNSLLLSPFHKWED